VRVRTNCCILPSSLSAIGIERTFHRAELRPLAATAWLANLPLKNTRQLAGTITDRARVDRGEPDDEAVEPTASPRMIGKRSQFDIGFRRRGGRRTVINFRRKRSRDVEPAFYFGHLEEVAPIPLRRFLQCFCAFGV